MRSTLTQLDGRAYRAWLPPPLSIANSQFKIFERNFRPPRSTPRNEGETQENLIDGVDTVRFRGWETQGPVMPVAVAAQAIDVLSRRYLQVEQFLEANRRLTGTKHPLRTGPAWMDALHPADSWYVAPPVQRVPELMAELAEFVRSGSYHPILSTFVAALRLLHIHPFKDGNGRTARCFAVARLRATGHWGPWAASAIQALCRTGVNDMSRCTLAIRDCNDWRPFLAWIATSTGT